MAVTYDVATSGYSGAPPSRLPFDISWQHTSASVSNPSPGASVWVVYYKAGVDVLTNSTRSCTWGGAAMESKNVVAIVGNSIVAENFVLTGQPTGAQTVKFTYNNGSGVRPAVVRAFSESFKGALGFGGPQSNSGSDANGRLTAVSDVGEMLTVINVARAANISNTSGTDRFTKNSVTPRVAGTDEAGAATVNISMTNSATDWLIGATRVLTGASEPPPPPPVTPTLPAVVPSPLGGVMLALKQTAPDVTLYPLATSAPTYTSPTTFDWSVNASKFRIGGTLVLSDHNGFQCGVNAASGQSIETNPLTAGLTSFEVEFWTVGTDDLTVKFRSFANSDYLILVDDMPISTDWLNFGNTGYRYQRIGLGDKLPHRIRILNGYNGFCGVIVPGGGDIQPAGARTRIGMTGDSYVQGAGSASEPGPVGAGGICGYLSLFLGVEVINLGQGTTGYIAEGVGGSRSKFGSAARLTALNAFDYDRIIIFGGGNDTSETPSAVVTAAQAMWAAVKTANPTTPLIVVGIQSPDLFSAAGMDALNDALRTAALADSNVDLWIDMREPEYWVTDVTESIFITQEFPASIHPGKAGSLNIAIRMMAKMALELFE